MTLTAANVKALNATPISLVPAPGSGYALIFEGAVVYYGFNTAAYAGIAGGEDLAVKYTDASGLQVGSCETASFLDQTSNQTRFISPYRAASGASDIIPAANAALVLHMLSGEITSGDTQLKLRVYYRIVPVTL